MEITIKPVAEGEEREALLLRQEVFERELGLALEPLSLAAQPHALHLLAWAEPGGAPAAALSVVDTSGEQQLYERYGLGFPPQARTARYTQLAVRQSYRGLDLPLRLICEAHRRFVAPGGFAYTWLLFAAGRAAASSFCRRLAFTPSERAFWSEYGLSRSLVRDENAPHARQAMQAVARSFAPTARLVWLPEQKTAPPAWLAR
jgi:GNAT superfamily N-acetyltransferase